MRGRERSSVRVLVLAALVAGCGAGDPPRLTVTTLLAATGSVRSDAGVESRLQIRNAGGRLLLLDGVEPPCGCAVTSALPAQLTPGATTTVGVACRASAGPAARDVRIWSSDPASPVTSARLPGATAAPAADPGALYFGYVALGASATRDVTLPAGVAVAGLPPLPSPALAVEPLPVRGDGRAALRVRFTPASVGVLRAEIDLGPQVRRLPVVGVGHRHVVAYPAAIRLAAASVSETLPAITVKVVGDAAVGITRVDYPPGVGGELRTVVPGRQYRLALRARGPVGEVGAAIRFLDANAEPVVIVPIVHDEVAHRGDAS